MPAGSKKGERRGGRKRGVPNKKTAAMQAEIAASGETPLEYMLRVMRDQQAELSRRDAMAGKAAPYVHPQLSAVKHSGDKDNPIQVVEWRVVDQPGEHAEIGNSSPAGLQAPAGKGSL